MKQSESLLNMNYWTWWNLLWRHCNMLYLVFSIVDHIMRQIKPIIIIIIMVKLELLGLLFQQICWKHWKYIALTNVIVGKISQEVPTLPGTYCLTSWFLPRIHGSTRKFLGKPRCKALNSWFRFLVRFRLLVCQVFGLPGKFLFLVFENFKLPGSR